MEEEKHVIVTFGDAELLRNKMKMNTEKFSEFIGVSRVTYYAWNDRGIPVGIQFLLRLIESNIGNAVNVRLLM